MRRADDHKRCRIAFVNNIFKRGHFGASNNAIQNETLRSRIRTRAFEDRHAALKFFDDAIGNGVRLRRDNRRRANRAAAFQSRFSDQSAHIQRDHRVEGLLPSEDKPRAEDDGRIDKEITLRDGNPAPMAEDARQNIRAAAGAARAIDQPIADAADDSAVECIEENISL